MNVECFTGFTAGERAILKYSPMERFIGEFVWLAYILARKSLIAECWLLKVYQANAFLINDDL